MISEKRKKEIENRTMENFNKMKEAIDETLLAYILVGDDSYKTEVNYYDGIYVSYVIPSGGAGYYCIIKAKEREFEFLSLNDEVTKAMHKKYNLHQNWYCFKDADKLMDMFKRCVLGFK